MATRAELEADKQRLLTEAASKTGIEQQNILRLIELINKELARSETLTDEENGNLETQIDNLKQILLSASDINSIKERFKELDKDGVKAQELLNSLSEKEILIRQNKLRVLQLEYEELLKSTILDENAIRNKQKEINDEQKLLDLERERMNMRKSMKDDANSFMSLIGLGQGYKDTFVGKLLTLGDKEWEEGLNAFENGIKDAFEKPEELLKGNFGVKMTELLVTVTAEMASAFAELNKSGGGAVQNFLNLSAAMNAAGVGLENAQSAVAGLNKNYVAFSELSIITQGELSRTTAQLDKLGFSADSSTKLLSNLTTGFNMTAEQASDTMVGVVELADDLKMGVGELGTQFEQVSGKLSVYGAKGVQVFKELAATAKATGLEVSTLVSIAEKMDTFEGAAETAGKLNAVLGGGLLNSSQLLNASESERIRLMSEAVQASGRSFDSLSKYEKMTIASAAGINDMSQANKIFGMSLTELDKFQAEAAASEANAATMAEALAEASTLMDTLKQAVFGLAKGLAPLILILTVFLNIILKIDEFTGGLLLPTLGFLITTTMILGNVSRITAVFQSIFAASNMSVGFSALFANKAIFGIVGALLVLFGAYHMAGSPMLYVIGFTMAASIVAIGIASEISSKQLYALGVAMAGMAAFAFALFYGMAALADSLAKLNGPQLLVFSAALIVFVGALYLVLTATPAIPVLLAIGAALLMVGASFLMFGGGIALVGLGISMIFDSMAKAASQGSNLLMLGASLYLISSAMLSMISVVANPIGLIGIGILVTSLTALSNIMGTISASVPAFVEFINAISNIPDGIASRLEPLVEIIGAIIEKINELNSDSGNALSSALNSLSDLGEASIKLTPENITNVSNLVDQAERYRNVVNTTKNETNNLLTTLINNVGTGGGSRTSTPVNVSIALDKLKLGKAMFDIMEDKMGLNISRPT